MKIISQISKDVISTWKEQYYNNDILYRPIIYLKYVTVNAGVLIYNTLTKEMIIISNSEYESILNNTLKENNELLHRYLVSHWFFIPDEYDEKTMAYMQEQEHRKNELSSRYINSFTILTTTDCNARCFYCYQLGKSRTNMTEETAMDVAEYIISRVEPKHRNKIYLRWFGGEPLYNSKVIDIICNRLKDAGVNYQSSMITNGYLFNDSLIENAVNLWNLKNLQITLDGPKKKYNEIKAYIYKDDNAFDKVIENMKKLIDNNIWVTIRCNLSFNNIDHIYELIDFLHVEMNNRIDKFSIYISPLFENVRNGIFALTDDNRKYLYTKLFEFQDYLIEKGFNFKRKKITSSIINNICMAESSSVLLISPQGNIGSCQHNIDSDFYSSIYDSPLNINFNIKRKWKKRMPEIVECKSCTFYPLCKRLLHCESYNFDCNEMYRLTLSNSAELSMLNTYYDYCKNHEDDIKKLIELNNRGVV